MLHIDSRPPDFVSAPWYNLVVRIDAPAVAVTTVNLQAALASQLGITFTGGFTTVRLQSVKVWGALVSPNASQPLQRVTVIINDPIGLDGVLSNGIGTRVLEQITDYPDQVNRAALGYVYPKAQREFSLRLSGSGQPLAPLLSTIGLGANSVIYFNVQWRAGITVAPTIIEDWNQAIDEDESDVEILELPTQVRPRTASIRNRNVLSGSRSQTDPRYSS